MKLLKEATEAFNIKTSQRKVYAAVEFTNSFMSFLETLSTYNLISSKYRRTKIAEGFRWDDQRFNGGLLIETSDHPTSCANTTRRLTIEGIPQALDLLEDIMARHGVIIHNLYDDPLGS